MSEDRKALADSFEAALHKVMLAHLRGDLSNEEISEFAQFAMDHRGSILSALRQDAGAAMRERPSKACLARAAAADRADRIDAAVRSFPLTHGAEK